MAGAWAYVELWFFVQFHDFGLVPVRGTPPSSQPRCETECDGCLCSEYLMMGLESVFRTGHPRSNGECEPQSKIWKPLGRRKQDSGVDTAGSPPPMSRVHTVSPLSGVHTASSKSRVHTLSPLSGVHIVHLCPVFTPCHLCPLFTPHHLCPVFTLRHLCSVFTPYHLCPLFTPHRLCPVFTPCHLCPVFTPCHLCPVFTPHHLCPVFTSVPEISSWQIMSI